MLSLLHKQKDFFLYLAKPVTFDVFIKIQSFDGILIEFYVSLCYV